MDEVKKVPPPVMHLLAVVAATAEEHLARLRDIEKLTGRLSPQATRERLQMINVLLEVARFFHGPELPQTKRVREEKDFIEKIFEKDLATMLTGGRNAR